MPETAAIPFEPIDEIPFEAIAAKEIPFEPVETPRPAELQPTSEQGIDVVNELGAQPGALPSPPAQGSDFLNLVGEPRGGLGEFVEGLDLASVPRDVLVSLTPVIDAMMHLKKGYDALRDVATGKSTVEEAAKQNFPESQALVGIEQKPLRERLATGLDTALQLIFAKQIAKDVRLARPQRVEPAAVAAAREAAGSAIAREIDQVIPAQESESVAADNVIQKFNPTENMQTVTPNARDVFEIPSNQIATRPDLMQFKEKDNEATGTNKEDRITTPYDRSKAGLITLWEPINPQEYGLTNEQKYIIANGHHRNEAAQEQGIPSQRAEILRESAGVSANEARKLAAWANIADGKGTIYDQARFIRAEAESGGPDEAVDRARQIGARSRKAETIAINAAPDLYSSFINEQITPEVAASIADIAPGNEGLQRLGIQRALKGETPAQIQNFLQAWQARDNLPPTAEQVDLFGADDPAIKAAELDAARAEAIQKEIGEQINAVAGAAKRPEKARAMGVDISDPASVKAKLQELRTLRERARSWRSDEQIRDLVWNPEISAQDAVRRLTEPVEPGEATSVEESGETGRPLMPSERAELDALHEIQKKRALTKAEYTRLAKLETKTQGDLFDELAGVTSPFSLAGEKGTDFEAQQRVAEAEAEARARAQAAADKAQTEMFASPEPPVLGFERPAEREVADDPNFTALPVDLPEAVRFSNELLQTAISVKKKLKALSGMSAGVFKYLAGKGEIHLRADIADLLTESDKANLRAEAQAYAERVAENERQIPPIAKQRYEYLLDQAYEEAKRKPPIQALKVIWHEIGHAVDYMQHAAEIPGVTKREIQGRGNLFGHIAALHDYLKQVIALDPTKPSGKPLTGTERAKLLKEAEEQLRKQFGPIGEVVETILVEEPILRVAGITPADVKNLFGLDAREATPELYKWFAEQTADVKKEIVRKAMRDVLDERLSAMGKTEQIGTRTVERTVRKRVGREPTPQEIQERFRKLFREELQRRNLAQLKIVKGELENAIAWWHGTEKMPEYFSTPEEMYAEAFSIFMNNPQALAKRAPTYTRLIWNYMEHRPEVEAVYDKIQNEIKSGQVKDNTEMAMLDAWDKADRESLAESRMQETRPNKRDWLDNVIYHIDRRFGPIYRAAKGAENEGGLRAAIGNFLYRASEHEFILNRLNREVSEPLVKANLDWKDLGRYMFYKRVVEERFKIFNPFGIAPDRALNRLENMRATMGDARFAQLEAAQQAFRRIYEERVVEPMKAERMWNKELQEAIDRNLFYATFDVRQTPEGIEDGISRLLKVRYGNLGPHIYRQIGTVKEIKNPATATVLKALSLTSSTIRNTLKREAVQSLLQSDRTNIMEARKRFVHDHWEYVPVENDKVGTVVYLRDGKPQAYYVRKVVADALNKSNHIENRLTLAAVRATSALKGLFTQLNYAFWPVNFVRDTGGWIVQLPGATPLAWAREFPAAMKAARDSIKGRPNPYADDALRRRMVISRADPGGIWSAAENEYEVKLASYGLNPASWAKEADKVHGIVKAWNSYREFGQAIERVNKIAAMNYLDRKFPDMPEWKKAEIVRERGGSPDFLQRGASNPYVDFVMMFYNPWKEAIRSVSRAARENPWSFTAKTTAFVAMPTMMQVLAASGAFGSDLEEQYKSVPDYDLSNYLIVPMGWADKEQKKVAYLRLPLWEPARILHGGLWGMATGRGQGLTQIYGGTLPTMNALLNVAQMWFQHEVMGKNPYDTFRGKTVLTDTTFAAGGWDARKELLKYSWNSLGGSVAYRFQNEQLDNPSTTPVEDFLKMPVVSNALGRWVKVSNRGISDLDQTVTGPMEKQRAQTRLAVQEIQRKMMEREALNPNERVLMRDPYAMKYFLETYSDRVIQRSDPLQRRLKGKPLEEKMMILRQFQEQP